MKIRLTYKIILMIFGSSIFMLGLMFFFGFSFSRQFVENQVSKLMLTNYTDVMKQVDYLVSNYMTQLNIISTDGTITQVLAREKK